MELYAYAAGLTGCKSYNFPGSMPGRTAAERGIHMDQLGESIRKLILAGIGAAVATKEKSEEVLKELVKKGELTVEQGKVLNEELKHNIKETIKENVTVNVSSPDDALMNAVDTMDEDQLAALKARIRAAAAPAETADDTSKTAEALETDETKAE